MEEQTERISRALSNRVLEHRGEFTPQRRGCRHVGIAGRHRGSIMAPFLTSRSHVGGLYRGEDSTA